MAFAIAGPIGGEKLTQHFFRTWRDKLLSQAVLTAGLTPRIEPLEARAYLTIALAPASDYGGVTSPAGIAVADFNNDGTPDVAVVGVDPANNLHSVGISLGGNPFVFYDLPGDNSAQDIVTGDFNKDGNTDIAVSDPVDGTVSILLGNGDGTFQSPVNVSYGTAQPVGTAATAYLATADFNGDGNADLAVTDPADHQIAILLGTGTGSFTLGTPITSTETSFDPEYIVTADFNGDNMPDLAFNDGTTAVVDLVLGTAGGTFAAPVATTVDGPVQGLATGDLNSDGQPDLAASVITSAGTGEVDVLINTGAAFGTVVPQPTTFANPGPLAVADINGDGLPDMVTMNTTGALDLFVATGAGGFDPAIESQASTSGSPQAIVTDDVNGDNKADILFSEINPSITDGGGFGLVFGSSGPEVSPAITGALPASAVSGQKTKITQTLELTNILGSPVKGATTVSIALSSDSNYSADDTVVDSVTLRGAIGTGKTESRTVKINSVPAGLTPGSYFVVIQVTDPSDAISTASSTGTLDIVAPQIDLTGAFKKAPTAANAGKHLAASITVTNNGNVPVMRLLPIVVDTSGIDTLDDTAVQASIFSKIVNIKPGKSITIQLSHLIAPVTPDNYYLIAQLDPNNTLEDVNPANNVFATGEPIVVS